MSKEPEAILQSVANKTNIAWDIYKLIPATMVIVTLIWNLIKSAVPGLTTWMETHYSGQISNDMLVQIVSLSIIMFTTIVLGIWWAIKKRTQPYKIAKSKAIRNNYLEKINAVQQENLKLTLQLNENNEYLEKMKYANSPEILKVVEKLADCKEERHQLFIQLEAIKAELASVKNTNQNLDGENRHLKEINKGLILKTVKKSNLEKISERK